MKDRATRVVDQHVDRTKLGQCSSAGRVDLLADGHIARDRHRLPARENSSTPSLVALIIGSFSPFGSTTGATLHGGCVPPETFEVGGRIVIRRIGNDPSTDLAAAEPDQPGGRERGGTLQLEQDRTAGPGPSARPLSCRTSAASSITNSAATAAQLRVTPATPLRPTR